jgi:cytochrome c oxidase cbb3-type subunit IV
MDVNTLRSAVTLVMLLMFVGIVVWTWSRSRRDAFDDAAALPFVDDAPPADTVVRAARAGEQR